MFWYKKFSFMTKSNKYYKYAKPPGLQDDLHDSRMTSILQDDLQGPRMTFMTPIWPLVLQVDINCYSNLLCSRRISSPGWPTLLQDDLYGYIMTSTSSGWPPLPQDDLHFPRMTSTSPGWPPLRQDDLHFPRMTSTAPGWSPNFLTILIPLILLLFWNFFIKTPVLQ